MPPEGLPIGLRLARTARVVTQAFERAMADAGGSAATFQILVLVRAQRWGTQAEMAAAMGITAATLTHHLKAMEAQGLVRRWREPDNQRVQHVALTDEGAALFARLRRVARRHDARLRAPLTQAETAQLADLLERIAASVAQPDAAHAAAAAAADRERHPVTG